MRVTRIEPLVLLEGRALGELVGVGCWTLERGDRTRVRYDWGVQVTRPWMRRLAPLLQPIFVWNHGVVMERGRRGLIRWLGVVEPTVSRGTAPAIAAEMRG
jgi:hypothetical protein